MSEWGMTMPTALSLPVKMKCRLSMCVKWDFIVVFSCPTWRLGKELADSVWLFGFVVKSWWEQQWKWWRTYLIFFPFFFLGPSWCETTPENIVSFIPELLWISLAFKRGLCLRWVWHQAPTNTDFCVARMIFVSFCRFSSAPLILSNRSNAST